MIIKSNNTDFDIVSESELSAVLARFSDDMIIDAMIDTMQTKIRPYAPPMANMIAAYERDVKIASESYPAIAEQIRAERDVFLTKAIQAMANFYNLEVADNGESNDFALAFYMYEFLISEFSRGLITFLCNYIIKEKSSIYSMLNIGEMKKKDGASSYSKTVMNGPSKLIAIHANLDFVLSNMQGFDIQMEDIINMLYTGNKQVINLLTNTLKDKGSFFKDHYVRYITTFKPETITEVRLNLMQTSNSSISEYVV